MSESHGPAHKPIGKEELTRRAKQGACLIPEGSEMGQADYVWTLHKKGRMYVREGNDTHKPIEVLDGDRFTFCGNPQPRVVYLKPEITELDFENGVEEAKRRLSRIKRSPVLVAVYGWPNSGKSFLIGKLGDYFEGKGAVVSRGSCRPAPSDFEDIATISSYYPTVMHFSYCDWERGEGEVVLEDVDPNVIASDVMGREMDFNIGIYNPGSCERPHGQYDLLISNPDSRER